MTIDAALKILYDKEINCSISSFWDGQWNVKIGDELNGFKAESTEVRIEDVGKALIEMAKEIHPSEDWPKGNDIDRIG
jgi:hypothetical protein